MDLNNTGFYDKIFWLIKDDLVVLFKCIWHTAKGGILWISCLRPTKYKNITSKGSLLEFFAIKTLMFLKI